MTFFQAYQGLRVRVGSWPVPLRWLGWACLFSAAILFAFYLLCFAVGAVSAALAFVGFPGLQSVLRSGPIHAAVEWGFSLSAIAAPGAALTLAAIGVMMLQHRIERRETQTNQPLVGDGALAMGLKLQRLLLWTITAAVLVPVMLFAYAFVSGEIKSPRVDFGMLLVGALMSLYTSWWVGAFVGAVAAIIRNLFPD
jgi:hypothetical protein